MFPVSSLAFFVRSWLEDLSEESRDLLTGGGEVMADCLGEIVMLSFS